MARGRINREELLKAGIREEGDGISEAEDVDEIRLRTKKIVDYLIALEEGEFPGEERDRPEIDHKVEGFDLRINDSPRVYKKVYDAIKELLEDRSKITSKDVRKRIRKKFPNLEVKESSLRNYISGALRYMRDDEEIIAKAGSRDRTSLYKLKEEEEAEEEEVNLIEDIKERQIKDYQVLRDTLD